MDSPSRHIFCIICYNVDTRIMPETLGGGEPMESLTFERVSLSRISMKQWEDVLLCSGVGLKEKKILLAEKPIF